MTGCPSTRRTSFVEAREKRQGASVGSIDNVPAAPVDVEDCLLAHQPDYSACNRAVLPDLPGSSAATASGSASTAP